MVTPWYSGPRGRNNISSINLKEPELARLSEKKCWYKTLPQIYTKIFLTLLHLFHSEKDWCILECYGFKGQQCLQCLDMVEALVGRVRGFGGWGHSGIWWSARFSIGFCSSLMPQEAESLESAFQRVWFRQDWQRYQDSQNPETLPLTLMQGNTVNLTISCGDPLLFSTFLLQGEASMWAAIHNPQCTFLVQIWEKREHDHSKDISKTIPVAALHS